GMKLLANTVALMTTSFVDVSRGVHEFARTRGDVGRKEMLEARDVSIGSRCGEYSKEAVQLGRIRHRRPAARDVLAGSGHALACVRLSKLKNVRDAPICIVEGFTKDVGGALRRRQPFQEHPHATRQCLISFRSRPRITGRVRWFRLPWADTCFPSRTR